MCAYTWPLCAPISHAAGRDRKLLRATCLRALIRDRIQRPANYQLHRNRLRLKVLERRRYGMGALVNPVVMQEVLQESRCAVAPVWDPGEGEDYDVAPGAASREATGRQLVAMDPNMDHMSPQYSYSNLDCAVSLNPSVGRLRQQNNLMSGLQHPSVGRFKRRSNVATTSLLDLKCAGFAVLGS